MQKGEAMSIDPKEVDYIARLAKLKLSEKERECFTHQLGEILDYMKKLNELDTKDVEPLSHVIDLKNVFREDEVQPSLPKEEALRNAPETDQSKTFFSVPRVIKS